MVYEPEYNLIKQIYYFIQGAIFASPYKFMFYASIALFLIAMPLSAIGGITCSDGVTICDNKGGPSWGVLLYGIMGVGSSLGNTTWLANPFIFLSWRFIHKERRKGAIIFSLAACITAGQFYFFPEAYFGTSGHMNKVTHFYAGYWLWFASMAAAFIASLLMPKADIVEDEEDWEIWPERDDGW